MSGSAIKEGKPFAKERTLGILADFRRDGFCVIGGVLDQDEVTALREATDHYMADEVAVPSRYVEPNHMLRHINELDPIFLNLLVRDPIYSLMEALFGEGMQQCGMNVLRSGRGVAIENWHVDDALFFPLPDDVPRHDPRILMPVYWLTVQMALSDIERIEHGPTQYVPGSHYSGRNAPENGTLEFEGSGPQSIYCKAGDIYLHDPQCWHRGAPNNSDRARYLLQAQYGASWGFQRYNAYIQHDMPEKLMDGANARLRGLVGPRRVGR